MQDIAKGMNAPTEFIFPRNTIEKLLRSLEMQVFRFMKYFSLTFMFRIT
jgi:hypothetical protein